MQRDEIKMMAAQAGASTMISKDSVETALTSTAKIEAFAKLVADKTRKELREEIVYTWVPPHFVDLAVKEEREACAKSLENSAEATSNFQAKVLIEWCATHIRARGEA